MNLYDVSELKLCQYDVNIVFGCLGHHERCEQTWGEPSFSRTAWRR